MISAAIYPSKIAPKNGESFNVFSVSIPRRWQASPESAKYSFRDLISLFPNFFARKDFSVTAYLQND
jgi:hypothetical protein